MQSSSLKQARTTAMCSPLRGSAPCFGPGQLSSVWKQSMRGSPSHLKPTAGRTLQVRCHAQAPAVLPVCALLHMPQPCIARQQAACIAPLLALSCEDMLTRCTMPLLCAASACRCTIRTECEVTWCLHMAPHYITSLHLLTPSASRAIAARRASAFSRIVHHHQQILEH